MAASIVGFFKDALAPSTQLFIALKEDSLLEGDVVEGDIKLVCLYTL